MKALRSEVDILTLTATPIPRTLNMGLSGLRDLSIIATPPPNRHAIKTFVGEWSDVQIKEACQRELSRGGQVYFLHNEVKSIERIERQLTEIVPQATIRVAHGQMRERELESVMLDFYHQRFNVLLCTTIVESGIDVPTANTIIINRADKLGLAQLHQLRGRVGRSHHRAYAYLIAPPEKSMTKDAEKRLSALESLEELGVGFTLATHDLEIRGAGELLPLAQSTEVELGLPALLPADYVADVHTRLVLYKRISNADSTENLNELRVELINRFGLLPEPAKYLFHATEYKLVCQQLGVTRLQAGAAGGRIIFDDQPNVDPSLLIELIQKQPSEFGFDGKNTLKFTSELDEPEHRIEYIAGLLAKFKTDEVT